MRLRVEVQPDRRFFLRIIAEYRSRLRFALRSAISGAPLYLEDEASVPSPSDRLRVDLLLSYQPVQGTVGFLGYGATYDGDRPLTFRHLTRQSDSFFVKLTYQVRRCPDARRRTGLPARAFWPYPHQSMPNAIILGTGHAVPDRIVTNDELAGLMDTSDEWIRTRTGIRERRWITPGETGLELARLAAERSLDAAGLAADDIDAIIYASSTPDHFIPGNGVLLQRVLGMETRPAFDLRQQCAGFVYAMSMADSFIRGGSYRRLLVIGQEIQSTRMDVSTRGRHTAVLFADGAGAVVVGATDDPDRGVLTWDLHAEGGHVRSLWVDEPGALRTPVCDQARFEEGRYFLEMDGREVFRHAVTRMPESVTTCLDRLGLGTEDVALLIPHQANLRISEAVQKRLGLRDDQVYNNIERFGNTTAATLPIALDECVRAGRLRSGDLLLLTAFGAGFVWGSVALRW